MSVALLRKSLESLEKWADAGIAFGLPPLAAIRLQEASLDIEGYLLTGGSDYTNALRHVPNEISQALEYLDPGTSLASEMRELHSTIKVYIERACPEEKGPDGHEKEASGKEEESRSQAGEEESRKADGGDAPTA